MPSRTTVRRTILSCLCLLAAWPVGSASAAGVASVSGGVLTYQAGSEDNSFTIALSGSTYSITDWGAGTVTAGAGCTSSSSAAGPMPFVDCGGSSVTSIVIDLGAGNDTGQVALDTVLPAIPLVVTLGDGNDSWNGSRSTADTVDGGAGNDSIDGNGGDDVLRGGADRDTINGYEGNDQLFGDGGNDTISGGVGDDLVDGGDGNDPSLRGELGSDVVRGGAGSDLVSGGLGPDRIEGGAGNDRLQDDNRGQDAPFRSADVLFGGPGIDTADYAYRLGEATALRLSLDRAANDGAVGERDNIGPDGSVENIKGGIMADVIVGSAGANNLSGESGNDMIIGLGGNDVLLGWNGNDRIDGGAGNDRVDGWTGADLLIGGAGTDRISGGRDTDRISSRDGARDIVTCGTGLDIVLADRRDAVNRFCNIVQRR